MASAAAAATIAAKPVAGSPVPEHASVTPSAFCTSITPERMRSPEVSMPPRVLSAP